MDWVPRVVVEFKLGFTTHDALTYSAKAATHKNIHPYLRYGVVIARGKAREAISSKMMRHGHNFDFMLILESAEFWVTSWRPVTCARSRQATAQ